MALHFENFCGSLEEESYLLKRAKKNWLTFEGASRWRSNSFSPGVSLTYLTKRGEGVDIRPTYSHARRSKIVP